MYNVYQPSFCPPTIYDKNVKTWSNGNIVRVSNSTLSSRYSILASLAFRANGSGSVKVMPNNLSCAYIQPPKNYF